MRDSDIDSLSADGAQDTEAITPPPEPRTAAGQDLWERIEALLWFIQAQTDDPLPPHLVHQWQRRIAAIEAEAADAPLREALTPEAIAEALRKIGPDGRMAEVTESARLIYAALVALAATPAPASRGTTSPDAVPYMSEAGTDESARVAPDQSDRTGPASAPAPLDVERNARIVAEYWRDEMMKMDDPLRVCAHPLAMVLAALDGETEPKQMGIPDDEYAARLTAPAAAAEDR